MKLDSIFNAIVYKRLALVDLPKKNSHQHELNGVKALREFFDTTEPISGNIRWCFLADDVEPIHEDGSFTFYDARAASRVRTGRTEWRMYYKGEFLHRAKESDVLVLIRTKDGRVFGLLLQNNSGWLRAAQNLFRLKDIGSELSSLSDKELKKWELKFPQQQILQELEIGVQLPVQAGDEEIVVQVLETAKRAGRDFPSTREMAELAQSKVEVDISNGDETLIRWLRREEELFRAMEKVVVTDILNKGFVDADDFIAKSLSVHNRRKSRMGYALMNHLATLFDRHKLRYEREKVTERKSKPDFLFPGQKEYRDASFDASLLLMLAAKSTLKERWRQILAEANRIGHKHLCTLEQAISVYQTDEMKSQDVTLVVPYELHASFTLKQQRELLTVGNFIDLVKRKQKGL